MNETLLNVLKLIQFIGSCAALILFVMKIVSFINYKRIAKKPLRDKKKQEKLNAEYEHLSKLLGKGDK